MEEKVCLMRKTVFTLSIIFILLASLGSSFATSSPINSKDQEIDKDSSDVWWENWIRDMNHNGIDDLIDEKINANSHERVPIYLKYERTLKRTDVDKMSTFDLELGYVFEFINTISARNVNLKDIHKLRQLPGVGMIELQLPIEPHLDISNPAIKARNSTEYSPNTAWTLGYLGKGVNIAIIDTGVDDNHESLMGKFVAGVSFEEEITPKDGTFNPTDEVGHGTYCAGIALGTGGTTDLNLDGEPDYMGVATEAKLIDVQYSINLGATSDQMTRSIQWVTDNKDKDWPNQPDEYDGIDVISISSNIDGTPGEAAAAAAEAGIIVVTSAGNDGPNNPPPSVTAWPDNVIVVASVFDQESISRDDDTIAVSSSRGPREDGALKPDISAPGQFITAPTRDSYKRYGLPTGIEASGTSFAAPHVAGVVAMMLEVAPNLTPQEVISILHDTAEARGEPYDPELSDKYNEDYGWGIVDAYKAVIMTLEYDDRPPIIDIESVQVSGTTATISWITHKKANSIIEYGKSPSVLDEEKSDLTNYTIDHIMTLTDLEEGTNYYFKIKGYDELGIGPGESTLSNFTTEILPDTKPPDIIDIEVVAKSDQTATIFWNTDELADSRIEYGLTTNYGDIIIDIIPMSMHSITLFDLEPETTYHFRVNSSDGSGNYNVSEDFNFTTEASPDETPPSIFGLMVTDITDTTARIIWETNEPSNYDVEVGETLSYGREFSSANSYWMTFSVKLTGLIESTRYYYKVESTDPSGNMASIGGDNTYFFTEGPPDITPPNIEEGPYVNVTESTATITWMTDEESDSLVEYGLDSNYGFIKSESNFVFIHQITLTGLDSEETYHFRVRSKDSSPNENEVISADYIFQTTLPADVTAPQLLSGPDVVKGEYTATISWITDELSTSEVVYGTDLNYGSTASEGTKVLQHIVVLTGLSPSTTYHFRIISIDESGNIMESGGHEFTTIMITIPIEIRFFDLQDGATLTGIVTIQGEVTGGNGPLQSVRFRVDNESWENLGQGSSFIITLDTSKYADGTHTLYVEAKVGVTGNEMIMVEDVTFVVDNSQETEEKGETSFWMLIAIIVVVLIIAMMVAISRSRRRSYPRTSDLEPVTASEAPFAMDRHPESDMGTLGFIPEEEPSSFGAMDDLGFIPDEEPVSGISFVPETTILSEEPEIAFIPDREAVSFGLDEGPTRYPVYDTVRCPKCKKLFNTDISESIHCPECGFSASLKG
jgi:subtilisin family serine protease